MHLVTGGAFQGKLEYAKNAFGLADSDIFECSEDCAPDFNARCLCHYERYVMYCMRAGLKPKTAFPEDTVVIMDDVFCGVVPADPELRAWRESCGRALTACAAGSKTVTRLFCGIPKKIK